MKNGAYFFNNFLTIDVKKKGKTITLGFHGRSIDRRPADFLIPIFEKYIDGQTLTDHNIELDMCDVDFINSSTITVLARMLENSKAVVKKLSIVYKRSVRWQRFCFETLKIFETQNKNIQIIGK